MKLVSDVLEEFAAKSLNEPLHNLSLFQNGELVGSGNGRLSVGESGKLVLTVSVTWPLKTKPARSVPSRVIPESELLTAEADTERGFKFFVARLYMRQGNPKVFPFSVRLTLSGGEYPRAGLTGIVTPFPENVFPCTSWIRDENPMFGGARTLAWLPLEHGQWKIGLRKEPEQTCRLAVRSKADGDPGVEAYAKAFVNALSFRLGRHIRLLAYSKFANKTSEVVLQGHDKPAAGAFNPPLLDMPVDCKTALLTKATEFFLDPANEPVLTALHVCWDTSKNNFPIQCLLVCSALEGLARHVLRKFGGSKNFKSLPNAGKIEKAGALLPTVIKVTPEELGAWTALRNPRAHGNFDWPAAPDEDFAADLGRAACVGNVVNKFVLALIGYQGPFCEYTTAGLRKATFPC